MGVRLGVGVMVEDDENDGLGESEGDEVDDGDGDGVDDGEGDAATGYLHANGTDGLQPKGMDQIHTLPSLPFGLRLLMPGSRMLETLPSIESAPTAQARLDGLELPPPPLTPWLLGKMSTLVPPQKPPPPPPVPHDEFPFVQVE